MLRPTHFFAYDVGPEHGKVNNHFWRRRSPNVFQKNNARKYALAGMENVQMNSGSQRRRRRKATNANPLAARTPALGSGTTTSNPPGTVSAVGSTRLVTTTGWFEV